MAGPRTPNGVAEVDFLDRFLAVGEAALAHGAAAHPGSDRYLVHLRLDASPTADDPTGILSLYLGPPLPAAMHGLLTCDGPVDARDADAPACPDDLPMSGASPPEEAMPTIGRWRSIEVVGDERPGSASAEWSASSTT